MGRQPQHLDGTDKDFSKDDILTKNWVKDNKMAYRALSQKLRSRSVE